LPPEEIPTGQLNRVLTSCPVFVLGLVGNRMLFLQKYSAITADTEITHMNGWRMENSDVLGFILHAGSKALQMFGCNSIIAQPSLKRPLHSRRA
jgi:hypothetical protein